MNIENINKIQEIISKQPHVKPGAEQGFSMTHYLHDCGTPSCIAGFVAHALEEEQPRIYLVEEYFGISYRTAEELCVPSNFQTFTNITPAQAVQALENIKYRCELKDIWGHVTEDRV